MEEKNDVEKNIDDFMMPGFRFHPTDEELVGFYLKRKLQQRSLPIELIKQVDIYKYDPWDLPKLASTGEKEWYFYCPRDRKYRNSTRPNRVTGSGFWKATGTDRPIYSSEGSKCIGLKKSLVFYRGRAAKGIKTDWMMHEFRLPSIPDGTSQPKKIFDRNYLATDSWAICRIFKKTNSMANRALSHSHLWTSSSLSQTPSPPNHTFPYNTNLNSETDFHPSLNLPSYKPPPIFVPSSSNSDFFSVNFLLSPPPEELSAKNDLNSSMLFNISPAFEHQGFNNGFSNSHEHELANNESVSNDQNQWGNVRSMGFPFSLAWDSPAYPSEISSSTNYSTDKVLYVAHTDSC